MTPSTRSAEHGTFTITRTYTASPARALAAWPTRRPRPDGSVPRERASTRSTSVSAAPRPTGAAPRGPVYYYEATYKDIVPGERLVYGYTMEAGDSLFSVSVATVEFAPDGAGTTLSLTEQRVFLDGGDTLAVREKGTGELLDSVGAALV